jgi:hypothetical protein
MEVVSRQLHAPPILLLKEETPLPKQEAGCKQEPVWMQRGKEKSLSSTGKQTTILITLHDCQHNK